MTNFAENSFKEEITALSSLKIKIIDHQFMVSYENGRSISSTDIVFQFGRMHKTNAISKLHMTPVVSQRKLCWCQKYSNKSKNRSVFYIYFRWRNEITDHWAQLFVASGNKKAKLYNKIIKEKKKHIFFIVLITSLFPARV